MILPQPQKKRRIFEREKRAFGWKRGIFFGRSRRWKKGGILSDAPLFRRFMGKVYLWRCLTLFAARPKGARSRPDLQASALDRDGVIARKVQFLLRDIELEDTVLVLRFDVFRLDALAYIEASLHRTFISFLTRGPSLR